ncbi:hypothetical protein RJ639_033487 [Escallonia herrerae]|uniref:Pentatricopeptide repeat-containing protein n=1 Tax=Escallonia herrerae TaxID=1293975 RepID=A0AA88WWC7_9ASTE|nr:hypothetical protein RJ639_033487 [Escallonia herrerae]
MIMCYVKAGDIVSARELFDQMMGQDVFSWSTLISGYISTPDMKEASKLFVRMPNPDIMSWNLMISGFDQMGNREVTSSNLFFKESPEKPGVMEFRYSRDCFVISWNAVIGGYASHGFAAEALELLRLMKQYNVRPTYIIFLSVFNACAYAGLVELGQIHFKSMVSEFDMQPLW